MAHDTIASLRAELNQVKAERDKLRMWRNAMPVTAFDTVLAALRPTYADELAAQQAIRAWLAARPQVHP